LRLLVVVALQVEAWNRVTVAGARIQPTFLRNMCQITCVTWLSLACCLVLLQVEAWNRVIVAGAGSSSSSSGGLTKEGFLTRWKVITLQDPRTAFEQVWLGCEYLC
jgi:hypothetical protein